MFYLFYRRALIFAGSRCCPIFSIVDQISSIADTYLTTNIFFHPWGKNLIGRQRIVIFPTGRESFEPLFIPQRICLHFSILYFRSSKSHPEFFERLFEETNYRIVATDSHKNQFKDTWLEILPSHGWGWHRGGAKPVCCQIWPKSRWRVNARWLYFFRKKNIPWNVER